MKTLQQWYNENQINYTDKQTLNKMGVSDYDYHNLQDLKQMVRCEGWARREDFNIKSEITSPIRKITFFTPTFNDSKPDASNYNCALVEDSNYQDWVVSCRPSHVESIWSDIVVKKIYDVNEAENNLNGLHPILAVAPSYGGFNDFVTWPYVSRRDISIYGNPDNYLLPLDIVSKGRGQYAHFAVYLGNGQTCSYNSSGTDFVSLASIVEDNSSASSASSSGFSSSGSSGASASYALFSGGSLTVYHPRIPFKWKDEIVRNLAKALESNYGKRIWTRIIGQSEEKTCYNLNYRNCEHFANRAVLGINVCDQLPGWGKGRSFSLRDEVWNSGADNSHAVTFDSLTSSDCSYEKNKINNFIQQAENNRTYARPRHQIEQEKFTARIEVRPNPPCKIQ